MSQVGAVRIAFSLLDPDSLPVFIMVKQKEQVISWQLPFYVDSERYNVSERTICPDRFQPTSEGHAMQDENQTMIIQVSTLSAKYVEFEIEGVFLDVDK